MSGPQDVLAAAAAGTGRLVLLVGDAGVGKSRLAGEVREHARRDGMHAVWTIAGRAGAPAFWPWTQLLATLPPDCRARHSLAAGLLTDGADATGRFAMFDDVAALLADAARERPILAVLDDLHEADAASLLLLAHVAPLLPGMAVAVVATVRTDVEPDRVEWAGVWADLLRHAETVAVGPLTQEQIADVVAATTGRPATDALADRIAARTGGNALFVCELARLLQVAPDAVDALPVTVRAVVGARLAQRSAACRRVVSAAAVLGTSVSAGALVDLVGEPAEDVLDAVQEAVRHGLLRTAGPDRVGFVHEIVRDAIYDLLPPAHRAHWHGIAAERAAAEGRAADAAYQHRHAGPSARGEAARWDEAAGRAALAMLAYEDAVRHFRAALDGSADPGRTQVLLGTALLAAGDADAARTAQLAAVRIAKAAADGPLLADAALGLGAGAAGFEVVLNDREQIDALEDALQLLGDDRPGTRAAVMARLSVALTFDAGIDRRAQLSGAAVDLARRCGDEAALGAALASYCDVIAGPEHTARRLELTDEIVDIAQRLRDPSLELLGRRQRLVARSEVGDLAGVEDEIRGYETLADGLRQPLYSWFVPLWRAALAFMQGRAGEARELLAVANELGVGAGSVNAQALVPTLRWFLAGEFNDTDDIEALFADMGLETMREPWVPITSALIDAQLGHLGQARARLDAAQQLLDALPRDSEWLCTTTQAAEAVALVGGHPAAEWLYDQLLPHAALFVVEGIGAAPRGSVERHLGLLAGALGDRVVARTHFERALEANRRLGAALLVARTLYDAATTLADDGLRADARAAYLELGATRRAASLGDQPPVGDAGLVRSGATWTVRFAGRTATLRDSKGLRDLSTLLARPGVPVPVVELAGAPAAVRPSGLDGLHQGGDLGEVIDATARNAYRRRLDELTADADEADRTGDTRRAAAVAAERDALLAQLSAAYGLGGRPRRAGSPVERARTTVTARIRDSIAHIATVHPELGRHLRAAIRTGTLCSYDPETPVSWQLTP